MQHNAKLVPERPHVLVALLRILAVGLEPFILR